MKKNHKAQQAKLTNEFGLATQGGPAFPKPFALPEEMRTCRNRFSFGAPIPRPCRNGHEQKRHERN